MSVQMIQERLRSYACGSVQEEDHAIREITQEVILAALSRTGFFGHALFQGGTCLRVFHGLNRFSEDLDFILNDPDPGFDLGPFLNGIVTELHAFGYRPEINDRSSSDSTVKKAFIKDDSLGKLVQFSYTARTGPAKKIRIKIEVDVNPPAGTGTELHYLDFPFVASVAVQDPPSLFAGKIHALLCRRYDKGRDWYDFLWYTAHRTRVNYVFLSSALMQLGPWKGDTLRCDTEWVGRELSKKIKQIDWGAIVADVRDFVPISEHRSLELWSSELFLAQVLKIR